MTRNRRWLVLVLAVALLGTWAVSFGVGRLQAQVAAPAAPSRVAVMNIAEIINASTEREAFTLKMTQREQKFQQDRQARQQALEQMQNDLSLLPAGAAERLKKEEEIIAKAAEFQAWQQLQQQLAARDQRLFFISLYSKIDTTTQKIAAQRGIDVVLLDTPAPNLEKLNPDQIIPAIGSRNVMFHNNSVDITADVTTQLNTDWANRG